MKSEFKTAVILGVGIAIAVAVLGIVFSSFDELSAPPSPLHTQGKRHTKKYKTNNKILNFILLFLSLLQTVVTNNIQILITYILNAINSKKKTPSKEDSLLHDYSWSDDDKYTTLFSICRSRCNFRS